jgi:hypothetical protein
MHFAHAGEVYPLRNLTLPLLRDLLGLTSGMAREQS